MTTTTKRILKNFFGDFDKDGTKNLFDCERYNPKKHGFDISRRNAEQAMHGVERLNMTARLGLTSSRHSVFFKTKRKNKEE